MTFKRGKQIEADSLIRFMCLECIPHAHNPVGMDHMEACLIHFCVSWYAHNSMLI